MSSEKSNIVFLCVRACGWAQPGPCRPGRHCVYECRVGYTRTSAGYTTEECPPVQGQCDDVYHFETSRHGLFCNAQGNLVLPPNQPLCQRVPSYVTIESRLSARVTGCPTVYPGSEDINAVAYTVNPRQTLELTLFPANYWYGVSRHYYVGNAGMTARETCQWDALPRTAYIWGGHLENRDGQVWQAANFDFSENFRASSGSPGYSMVVHQCPTGGTCWKYCEIKRRVVGNQVEDYAAVFRQDGSIVKEFSTPTSECYIYGPVTQTRTRVDLVPYT